MELDTSACGCRAGSLAGARLGPLPASPARWVAILAHVLVAFRRLQFLLRPYITTSEPFQNNFLLRKICSEELIFRHVQDIALTENENS